MIGDEEGDGRGMFSGLEIGTGEEGYGGFFAGS